MNVIHDPRLRSFTPDELTEVLFSVNQALLQNQELVFSYEQLRGEYLLMQEQLRSVKQERNALSNDKQQLIEQIKELEECVVNVRATLDRALKENKDLRDRGGVGLWVASPRSTPRKVDRGSATPRHTLPKTEPMP